MPRGFAFLARRTAYGLLSAAWLLGAAACANVLGIDDGIPIDAGATDAGGGDDVSIGDDAPGDDAAGDDAAGDDGAADAIAGDTGAADASLDADGGDASVGGDSGKGEAGADAGKGEAGGDSSAGDAADACTDPGWCTTHCGQSQDLCGVTKSCGGCSNGLACDPTTHTCVTSCVPLANPCAGRCEVTVDNGCGQSVTCPGSCPSGAECANTTCCVPAPGCTDSCVDSCGLPGPCCDAGGVGDATTCGALGQACMSASDCCSGACQSGGKCANSCVSLDGPCTSTSQCCVGLTCFSAIPLEGGAVSSDASGGSMMLAPSGICE